MSKRTAVSLTVKNLWQAVRKVVYARVTILSVACLIVLCADLVLASPASTGQERYDLGGPCEDQPNFRVSKELHDAESANKWDRAVVLTKEDVRAGGCNIPYRWYRLVSVLLSAHRSAEASSVLQEMDGFDVELALLGEDFPEIVNFMEGKEFGASTLGLKIRRLENISDERRIKFQEALSRMPASEKPPDNYIAKGACPFECCRYGNWTVLEDTDLVSSPKGSRAFGLTGEVHLRPEPDGVLTADELPKNSIAFILDYIGEGYGHVYTRGKVVEVQTHWSYTKYCYRPSESCWSETLWPSKERKEQIWWVKVRLPNGIMGWTDKTHNFGDKDACA